MHKRISTVSHITELVQQVQRHEREHIIGCRFYGISPELFIQFIHDDLSAVLILAALSFRMPISHI